MVVGHIQKVGHMGKDKKGSDQGRGLDSLGGEGGHPAKGLGELGLEMEVGLFAMPQVQEEDRVGDGVDVEIVLEEDVRQGQNRARIKRIH